MSVIGFIGLGIMGQPMAANLVRAGHDVVGYNRSRSAVDQLVRQGGRAASSVADACAAAEFVITMLPDTPDVEQVARGDGGVLASIRRGSTYVDMSTIRPATARRLAVLAKEVGVGILDAPVSGGDQAAVERTLSIMVGGDYADVQKAMPMLETLGSTVTHVGPAGAGQTVKAANQLVVAGIIELIAEAIVFVEAHDVDAQAAMRVLATGLGGNQVLNRKGAAMLARHFAPGFRVDLHHKDLGIVVESARAAQVAIPLGAHVAQLMSALRAQGDGGLDHTALLRLVQRLSGRDT